jgi:hypothetical protein
MNRKRMIVLTTVGLILVIAIVAGMFLLIQANGEHGISTVNSPDTFVPIYFDAPDGPFIINTSLPSAPLIITLYRGYYGPGGCVTFRSPNESLAKASIPDASELPTLAQKVLEPYGGIPLDAVVAWRGKSTSHSENLTTGEVIAEYLESANIGYTSKDLGGIPISGQNIRLSFGENGELLRLDKHWRTLEQIDRVPIINASAAMEKLRQGDVIGHWDKNGAVTVNRIFLVYYDAHSDQQDVILEPVWVFVGKTPHGGGTISYLVDARVSGSSLQFANFTATPRSGKAPLTVSFNDTSKTTSKIDLLARLWQFGDGTKDYGPNPIHVYQKAGNYSVKFDAYDNGVENSINKTDFITVTES